MLTLSLDFELRLLPNRNKLFQILFKSLLHVKLSDLVSNLQYINSRA